MSGERTCAQPCAMRSWNAATPSWAPSGLRPPSCCTSWWGTTLTTLARSPLSGRICRCVCFSFPGQVCCVELCFSRKILSVTSTRLPRCKYWTIWPLDGKFKSHIYWFYIFHPPHRKIWAQDVFLLVNWHLNVESMFDWPKFYWVKIYRTYERIPHSKHLR